jgi:hypothetical protein
MKSLISLLFTLVLASCITQDANQPSQPIIGQHEPETVLQQAEAWVGQGAMNTADVINRVISDQGGPPDAYIMGEEASVSLGAGVRYGKGNIYFRDGTSQLIYWRGASLGVDIGANASRTFILIYGADRVEDLYTRLGGVEGSVYIIVGLSVTYHQGESVVVAPVRVGVGLRAGINIGYIHFSPDSSINPF